jgi:hypothetical protein
MNFASIKKNIFLQKKNVKELQKYKNYIEQVKQFRINQNNKRVYLIINNKWDMIRRREKEIIENKCLIKNGDENIEQINNDQLAETQVEQNSLVVIPKQINIPPSVGVVIAHYNEDLSWTFNIKYKCRIISKYGMRKETPPNKGNEASSYLQYIINNYDMLDDYTIFVHGHRTAWHHSQNTDEKINNMQFVHPYYNINDGGLNTLTNIPEWNKMRYMIPHVTKLFTSFVNLRKVVFRNSAQFYVHKSNILRHKKETYIKMYTYLMNSRETSYWTGRVFEYLWHIIFTGSHYDVL